jgi:hypothetical protein
MTLTKSKLLFPLVSLVLAVYCTLPFLLRYDYWGVRDWDLFTTIAAVPVGTIVHYGQFPFWNPYLGGGNILFHHPEVAVLSPFLLLLLVFGVVVGLKLQVAVCYFLGFWGSLKLFTSLGASKAAAIMAAVAYFGSVHFALHFAEGHIPFTHYAFLPWFVYFILTAGQKRRNIILAGIALALMVLGNGAAVPLLYTLLFSFVFFGILSVQERQLTYIRNFAVATVTGLGAAAVKLVPMVVYMFQNKWEGNPDESIPLSALGSIFFGLKHSLFAKNFPQQYWNWHEYGHYLSPLLVILAVIALLVSFRKHMVWLLTALFFFLLGLGNFGSFSLWALLTRLPGFESLRCTGRAFQFVDLSVAALGAFGFDILRRKISHARSQRWLRYPLPAVAAVVIGTNLVLVWPIMSSAFTQKPKTVRRSPVFTHVIDRQAKTYENFLANRGSLITPWLSAYHPSRALVGPGDTVYMEHILEGRAEIRRRYYTPNRIEYEIFGESNGKIVIGMGYDPGWRVDDGRRLWPEQDLLAFAFQPGLQRVVLRYRPPFFFAGLMVSLISLAGILFFWRRL